MGLDQISVSPYDYVVMDVETNGLKSREHDLLSISIYKPDDGKIFDRFLPLDLNMGIPDEITAINGIRESDLRGLKPLSQDEVDRIIDDFELNRRTILIYGSLDERFVRDYFQRNKLLGYSRMKFFNFKQLISATQFSDGTLTKDNLCKMFGIAGVTDVHSGANDCVLEWNLFEAIGGRHLIARMQTYEKWTIDVLSPDYVVPVSYLATFSNLSELYPRPRIYCESKEIYDLVVSGDNIKRFQTNFSGMTMEHLIDCMLGASGQSEEEKAFLRANSAKNIRLGYADHKTRFVPLEFTSKGTVACKSKKREDQELAEQLNKTIEATRCEIAPLVEHIRCEIFKGKPIKSQELSINADLGILALSDLSTEDAVMEVKTSYHGVDPARFAEQIYYEAKGRAAYLLVISWLLEKVEFKICEIVTYPGKNPGKRKEKGKQMVSAALESQNCELVEYFTSDVPVLVRCKSCGREWEESYGRIKGGKVVCRSCFPKTPTKNSKRVSPEEALAKRARKYEAKVSALSGGFLLVDVGSYTGSKERVVVHCSVCGRAWAPRADHLLNRCFCPSCHAGEV